MFNPISIDAEWVPLPASMHIMVRDGLIRDGAMLGDVIRSSMTGGNCWAFAKIDGRHIALGKFKSDAKARAAVEEAVDAITKETIE